MLVHCQLLENCLHFSAHRTRWVPETVPFYPTKVVEMFPLLGSNVKNGMMKNFKVIVTSQLKQIIIIAVTQVDSTENHGAMSKRKYNGITVQLIIVTTFQKPGMFNDSIFKISGIPRILYPYKLLNIPTGGSIPRIIAYIIGPITYRLNLTKWDWKCKRTLSILLWPI